MEHEMCDSVFLSLRSFSWKSIGLLSNAFQNVLSTLGRELATRILIAGIHLVSEAG